jgi:hypothetical protein
LIPGKSSVILVNPDKTVSEIKVDAWRAFRALTINFLGDVKAEHYESHFEEPLSAYMTRPIEEYLNENTACFKLEFKLSNRKQH